MVSGCPFLIQVTLVAGEPVEIQVRLDDTGPWVNPRCVMLGGAREEYHTTLIYYTHGSSPNIMRQVHVLKRKENECKCSFKRVRKNRGNV